MPLRNMSHDLISTDTKQKSAQNFFGRPISHIIIFSIGEKERVGAEEKNNRCNKCRVKRSFLKSSLENFELILHELRKNLL